MKKMIWLWAAVGVAVLAIGVGGYIYYLNTQPKSVATPTKTTAVATKKASPAPKAAAPAAVSPYFFPMSNFDSRIQYRWFGKYVTAADKVPDCGAVFVGYHDGDDLEATAAEKAGNASVYAVADGTIRLVQHISGYGGLLVMGATINGQAVTLNYGHIRLSSVSLKVGDSVKAGQQLAQLGTGCSTETDGERKHLHFAIHKGTSVDVAGYVQTVSALGDWLDPKALLDPLKPNSPS